MAEYVMLHLFRFENLPVLEAPAFALALLIQTRLAPYLPIVEEYTDSIRRLSRRGVLLHSFDSSYSWSTVF